jgi:hypothetical protein
VQAVEVLPETQAATVEQVAEVMEVLEVMPLAVVEPSILEVVVVEQTKFLALAAQAAPA